jgi:hypothetical protein
VSLWQVLVIRCLGFQMTVEGACLDLDEKHSARYLFTPTVTIERA